MFVNRISDMNHVLNVFILNVFYFVYISFYFLIFRDYSTSETIVNMLDWYNSSFNFNKMYRSSYWYISWCFFEWSMLIIFHSFFLFCLIIFYYYYFFQICIQMFNNSATSDDKHALAHLLTSTRDQMRIITDNDFIMNNNEIKDTISNHSTLWKSFCLFRDLLEAGDS